MPPNRLNRVNGTSTLESAKRRRIQCVLQINRWALPWRNRGEEIYEFSNLEFGLDGRQVFRKQVLDFKTLKEFSNRDSLYWDAF